MPKTNEYTSRGYSKFDNMSIETLQEILRLDSMMVDDDARDMDAILYILKIIDKRESEHETLEFTCVEDAWRSFNENYRQFASDGKPLYGYEDDEIEEIEEILPITEMLPAAVKKKTCRRRRRHGILRVASVAIVTIGLLCAGSFTAYAFGYDLWGAVATWNRDIFSFDSNNSQTVNSQVQSEKETPEKLEEFSELMAEHDVSISLLPSYIPEGYDVINMKYEEMPAFTRLQCFIKNGENSIRIQYFKYPPDKVGAMFEKNWDDPEPYMVGDTTYYIMTNDGEFYVVWLAEDVECHINGLSSRDELINMIDSINGG